MPPPTPLVPLPLECHVPTRDFKKKAVRVSPGSMTPVYLILGAATTNLEDLVLTQLKMGDTKGDFREHG